MKTLLILSLLSLALSAPQITELYSIPSQYYNNLPEYYISDEIFVSQFIYYPNNFSYYGYFPIHGCLDQEAYITTSNNKFFCVSSYWDNFTNLTQFDPYTKKVIQTYYFEGNYLATSQGNYIILYNPTQNNSLDFQIFDANQDQFTCHFGPYNSSEVPNSIFVYNYTLLYSATPTDTNILTFYNGTCDSNVHGKIEYQKGPNPEGNGMFNDSTIFVEYYSQGGNYYLLPFTFENGQIDAQIPVQIVDFYQINDTNFLYSYQDPQGYLIFEIAVFNKDLEPFRLGFHNISVISDFAPIAQPIIGLDQLIVNFDEVTYQYDFISDQILWVAGINPPIVLANGSVINMTSFGYFLQNPGGPIMFINGPSSSIFQTASNPLVYYSLYIPTGKYPVYPNCTLLTIDTVSSSISYTDMKSCTLENKVNAYYVKDVKYDQAGNVYVAYKQQLDYYIYVVSSAYDIIKNFVAPKYFYSAVNLDLINNITTNVLGFVSSISIQTFDLYNGTLIQTKSIAGLLNNYVYHLTGYYFLFGETSSISTTNFYLYNANTSTFVSNFTVNVAISPLILENFNVPYFALGVDESNAGIYNGLVCWTLNKVFLYNSAGQGFQLNMNGLTFQGAFAYSDNTFVVVGVNSTFIQYSMVYEVTDWGTLDHKIEYVDM